MSDSILPSPGAGMRQRGFGDARRGTAPAPERGSIGFGHMPVAVIILFWVTQVGVVTGVRFMKFADEQLANVVPRALVGACAVLISLGLLAVLRAVRSRTWPRRALIAVGLAVAGCCLHTAVNMVVFMIYTRESWDYPLGDYLLSYAVSLVDFIWFYSTLVVILLALTYGEDLVRNRQLISALEDRANFTRLNALRYQLNPHFLFNTLNSVASLISKKKMPQAEMMVIGLSDFLRSTITREGAREIPLGEELEFQSLYLEIEKIRFPERLRVSIDVPRELRDALVPNLITQPLIENAIKHGVGRSSTSVHLEVIARAAENMLSLEVRDDGGDARAGAAPGTHVGLRNVAERVRLCSGGAGSFSAGKRPDGGFSARILIPLRRAGAAG